MKSPGVDSKRILKGPHRIRWVAPTQNQTYINIEVLDNEISNNEFHQLGIRCLNQPPTWKTLKAAFADLIQYSAVTETKPERVPFDPQYSPAFLNNQQAEFLGATYTILTHASPFWDRPRTTEPAIKNIIKFSDEHLVPSIGLISSQTTLPYFFKKTEVTYIAQSEAGQLRFTFPNARNFIFGGGNLKLCLCESIRDVILGSIKEKIPLNLFVVTDGVFDRLGLKFAWPGLIESVRGARKEILRQRYTIPLRVWEEDRIVEPRGWAPSIPGSFLLDDLFKLKPRQLFLAQIEHYVLRTKPVPGGLLEGDMCIQNSYNFPKLDRRLVQFQIIDGLKPLSISEFAQDPPFTVRMVFVSSASLKKVFSYWKDR